MIVPTDQSEALLRDIDSDECWYIYCQFIHVYTQSKGARDWYA